MRKIIATDYDGTLNQGGIQPHVAEAIERFRAAGNLFGVVTGRDGGCAENFRREGKFGFDFVLALNGAMAFDADANRLYAVPVDGTQKYGDTTLSRALIRRVWELTGYFTGIAFTDGSRLDICPYMPEGGRIKWTQVVPFTDLETDVFARADTFAQINTFCDTEEEAGRVTAILKEEFAGYVNPLQNGTCIDIPTAGMDKGRAVAEYAARMGVADEDIYTAGDNFNDLAMLERFNGCAMSGGVEAAKAVSKYVCKDIAEVVELIMGK